MAQPPSDLDDYLDWQERLESYRASGLEVDVFCLQEGVSRSTFYRWVDRLKDGMPKSMVAEKAARERAESGEAAFVPITLKASPVEIELPNGGIVRLPLGVGQAVLVEVIRAVGALRPWQLPRGPSAVTMDRPDAYRHTKASAKSILAGSCKLECWGTALLGDT